jgi:hypothetical protein
MRIRKCGWVIAGISSLFLATKLFAGISDQYIFPYSNGWQPNLITIYKDPKVDSLANSLGYAGKLEDFCEIGERLKEQLQPYSGIGMQNYYRKYAKSIGVDIDIMDFIEGRTKIGMCIEWAVYMANLAIQKGYTAEVYVVTKTDGKTILGEEAHALVRIIGKNEELILGVNGYKTNSLEQLISNITKLEEECGFRLGFGEKIFILKLPRVEDFDGEEKDVWRENADVWGVDITRMEKAMKWFEKKIREVKGQDPYKTIGEIGAAVTDFNTTLKYKIKVDGF